MTVILFSVEPPIWFTELSSFSITINWELEKQLAANLTRKKGHVCECKTTGVVGDLIPDDDCRCVLISLAFGKTTFDFNDVTSGKTRVFFFKIPNARSTTPRRQFTRMVKLPT